MRDLTMVATSNRRNDTTEKLPVLLKLRICLVELFDVPAIGDFSSLVGACIVIAFAGSCTASATRSASRTLI